MRIVKAPKLRQISRDSAACHLGERAAERTECDAAGTSRNSASVLMRFRLQLLDETIHAMRTFFALLLGGMAAFAATLGTADGVAAQEAETERTTYQNLDLFISIIEQVRESYVEDVDETQLIENAISGMLTYLDPHSSYLSAEELRKWDEQTSGQFSGLGIEVTLEQGFIKVVSPIDNTPAAEAGLQPGDYITQLNGESVLGLSLDEAVKKMRGPVGSEITLTIEREEVEAPFDVVITRGTIKTPSGRVRLEGDAMVVRITSFNEQTVENVESGIRETIEEVGGKENLVGAIIDLRNNPGGFLDTAIDISDAFLDDGEIVSIRQRDGKGAKRFVAEPGDILEGLPIAVLINQGSASASEIVAGALQDHDRAVIVGTKSFGKGSVQTLVPLGEEYGALRLTTARYYTPSGRSIQAQGIFPDVVVQQRLSPPDEEEEEEQPESRFISEADISGSLENDSLIEDLEAVERAEARQEAMAELRKADPQMAYAIDMLLGISVFNSGS